MLVLHYLLSVISSFTLARVFSVLDHISCCLLIYLFFTFMKFIIFVIRIFFSFTESFKLFYYIKLTYCSRCITYFVCYYYGCSYMCIAFTYLILHPLSDLVSDSVGDEWKPSQSFSAWVFSFCLSFHCTFLFSSFSNIVSYFLYFLTSLLYG